MTHTQLKAARNDMKLTADQLATILGMGRRKLLRMESGERRIPRVVALAIVALKGW